MHRSLSKWPCWLLLIVFTINSYDLRSIVEPRARCMFVLREHSHLLRVIRLRMFSLFCTKLFSSEENTHLIESNLNQILVVFVGHAAMWDAAKWIICLLLDCARWHSVKSSTQNGSNDIIALELVTFDTVACVCGLKKSVLAPHDVRCDDVYSNWMFDLRCVGLENYRAVLLIEISAVSLFSAFVERQPIMVKHISQIQPATAHTFS